MNNDLIRRIDGESLFHYCLLHLINLRDLAVKATFSVYMVGPSVLGLNILKLHKRSEEKTYFYKKN